MTISELTEMIDPVGNLPEEAWLDRIEDIAEDHGYFEPLGPHHSAVFLDSGPSLLVTFETIESARSRASSDAPLGWELASTAEWSQLCMLSHKETWYRHQAVYSYFDQLVDDGFFDRFERVVFYGAQSCGYAAAAYSVAAPGATVIAISPQATLDPRISEWDNRFDHMRRTSFTDRYGFAPDMVEAADKAFILYDPENDYDAMHAALFTRANVERFRFRYLDDQIESYLRRMELLEHLIAKAMAGTLARHDFHRALHERRNYLPYLRKLLGAVERQDRPYLSALVCRAALERFNAPRFQRQMKIALARMEQQGMVLPAPAQRHRETA